MCNNTPLQQKIRKHTDNGDLIIDFLADTVEGKYPDAKYHHKLEAARLLSRYGSSEDDEHQFWGLIPTLEELAEKQREENPPLPEGEGRGEGEHHPTTNPSSHNAATSTHHSAEHVYVEARSDNPAEQDRKSPSSMSALPDLDSDTPDCYFEPPTPEIQAIFDHQVRIETGGYPEGEIPDEPPPPQANAQATFEADLKRIREAAARDGVPVLPNPLADRFKHPTIHGP